MTTQHSYDEPDDAKASVVEHQHVPESQPAIDAVENAPENEKTEQADISSAQESLAPVAEQVEEQVTLAEAPTSDEVLQPVSSIEPQLETQPASIAQENEPESPLSQEIVAITSSEEPLLQESIQEAVQTTAEEETSEKETKVQPDVQAEASSVESTTQEETQPVTSAVAEAPSFTYTEVIPLVEADREEVRPFTDFIEEFRQAEARLNASLQTPSPKVFATLLAPTQTSFPSVDKPEAVETSSQETPEPVSGQKGSEEKNDTEVSTQPDTSKGVVSDSVSDQIQAKQEEAVASTQSVTEPPKEEAAPPPTSQPPVERAVSPLLRPATRVRVPRHSRSHQREEVAPEASASAQPTTPVQPVQPAAVVEPQAKTPESSVPTPAPEVAEPPRPARRYRFDRPASTNGMTGSLPTVSAQPTVSQQRIEDVRDKDNHHRSAISSSFPRLESGLSTNDQPTEPQTRITPSMLNAANEVKQVEPPVLQQPTQQRTQPAENLSPTVENGRRAKDKQKEQVVAPIQEPVTPVEIMIQPEEIAPEDLPPLEYSELQKASGSRRRRRHRSSANSAAPTSAPVVPEPPVQPVALPPPPAATPPALRPNPTAPAANNNNNAYTIVSGYTINQMNQGNEVTGPFMGPEPSPARGSVLSRDGRTTPRADAQRLTTAYPSTRPAESAPSSTSINHLTNAVVQAIQMQTDRMVAEMRRGSQTPANVSVTLPPFPSTERVGVFVDVANLLYSARTLRISVDFGKLLDFLRGNRRLVRAHAYCPTSPQPSDEQMFLQAVKGLGYRITTKNYKTFSSGAKKADLDLDLCMDVVRLVEGKAVDCIVLVSGDSDFMPMLDYCSDHGVRVEVAAFDEAMSATLRQSCDLFINLSMLEEIRS